MPFLLFPPLQQNAVTPVVELCEDDNLYIVARRQEPPSDIVMELI